MLFACKTDPPSTPRPPPTARAHAHPTVLRSPPLDPSERTGVGVGGGLWIGTRTKGMVRASWRPDGHPSRRSRRDWDRRCLAWTGEGEGRRGGAKIWYGGRPRFSKKTTSEVDLSGPRVFNMFSIFSTTWWCALAQICGRDGREHGSSASAAYSYIRLN